MSQLSLNQQCDVIAHICEGNSIRSTERLTGHHRNTIMRLCVAVGEGCNALHGTLVNNIHAPRIEIDEVWSFVKKKRNRVTAEDPDTVGEQYIYFAMDAVGKCIISWLVGKRTRPNTVQIVEDVRRRVLGNPEIGTDGLPSYRNAITDIFGESAYGVVDKQTVFIASGPDSKKQYVREQLVAVERIAANGTPKQISTSYIERQNLTLRMSQRRLTRDCNGFSKKFENHCASIALYVAHYNFCRVHETLRITPAMQVGITDHIWTLPELVQAATGQEMQTRVARAKARGRFRVIKGGKKDD
jgi:IS1 family transposase